MLVNEYQLDCLRTASLDDKDRLLNEGALGLSSETGEVVSPIKKYLHQGHELDRAHIEEELGDLAFYMSLTAHAIGTTLEAVFRNNIEKRNNRFPNGFETERSVNRG